MFQGWGHFESFWHWTFLYSHKFYVSLILLSPCRGLWKSSSQRYSTGTIQKLIVCLRQWCHVSSEQLMLQPQIKLQYGRCCFIKQVYRNKFGEEVETEFNFTLQLNFPRFVYINKWINRREILFLLFIFMRTIFNG